MTKAGNRDQGTGIDLSWVSTWLAWTLLALFCAWLICGAPLARGQDRDLKLQLLSSPELQYRYDHLTRRFWAARDLDEVLSLNNQIDQVSEILTERNRQEIARLTVLLEDVMRRPIRTLEVEKAKSRHKAFWRVGRIFGYHPSGVGP